MNLLEVARAERRKVLWGIGIWTTRDFQEIHVGKMSNAHLNNTHRLLLRWAENHLAKIVSSYACGPYPQGEGAQDAFDAEFEYWLDADATDVLRRHPFYPSLIRELESRGKELQNARSYQT